MEETMTGKKNQEKMKIYNEIIDLLVCIFVSCSCLVAHRKGEQKFTKKKIGFAFKPKPNKKKY